MIYLTVNDAPSGVYKSQVIDVLNQINTNSNHPVKLISFISLRGFNQNKSKIKSWYKHSTVLPMVPGIQRWFLNKYTLKLKFQFKRSETCIARNVMAYAIASAHFKQVIYDGRGAIGEELTEFPDMIPIDRVVNDIILWEKKAVLDSKYRIAVSEKLVEHWRNKFNYTGSDHAVIPCTVSQPREQDQQLSKADILRSLNWNDEDIIIVYSGGIAGWQSFDKLTAIIPNWVKNQNVKVLFLTKKSEEIEKLTDQYPEQIKRLWLKPEEVHQYTSIGDYGILIRTENMTNYVASPVKFAEYLMAGLKIIISNHIGDFSGFVKKNNCGHIFTDLVENNIQLTKTSEDERKTQRHLASKFFSKSAYNSTYKKLLEI